MPVNVVFPDFKVELESRTYDNNLYRVAWKSDSGSFNWADFETPDEAMDFIAVKRAELIYIRDHTEGWA